MFTNPPGDSAGRLVDDAGCKGLRRGSAHVSEKHANFIQADEGGSADDVWALMHEVRQLVEETTGVRLAWEVVAVNGIVAAHHNADYDIDSGKLLSTNRILARRINPVLEGDYFDRNRRAPLTW